jgi:hypothetical protein
MVPLVLRGLDLAGMDPGVDRGDQLTRRFPRDGDRERIPIGGPAAVPRRGTADTTTTLADFVRSGAARAGAAPRSPARAAVDALRPCVMAASAILGAERSERSGPRHLGLHRCGGARAASRWYC